MDKKKWLYVGIGLFCLLVVMNSTKKVELKPVSEVDESNTKTFDNTALPIYLKPPTRLKEGDNLPKLNVPKRLMGFTLGGAKPKQRFDIL
jgi:hypothetical protein